MTKQQYFEFAARFFEACQTISKAKNADYTGGAADPFANFKAVEILGFTTEQGFLTRMMDKMKRIASFAEKGELQVKDESVTDTLRDLANYACLLAGYIESKKEAVVVGDSVKGEAVILREDIAKEYQFMADNLKRIYEDSKRAFPCSNVSCAFQYAGTCTAGKLIFDNCKTKR